MEKAYIGLGSNLGDAPGILREAYRCLASLGTVAATSDLYRTLPWGKRDQPDFYNSVVALNTLLPADRLLEGLVAIEQAFGRVREERFGPRTLDLDLLLYDDLVSSSADCSVPHPRLRERAFVLAPLSDIAADLPIPPDGATSLGLLAALPAEEKAGVRKLPGTASLTRPTAISYDAPGGAATDYEALRPVTAFSKAIFEATASAIRLDPRQSILDVGCGTGRYTRMLAESGASVVGLDRSHAMLEAAESQRLAGAVNPNYVLGDAEQDLPGGPFDAITAFFSVHHLASPARFCEQAHGKLKDGGALAIATFPHRHFAETELARFFPSLPAIDMARFPAIPLLERVLAEAGFLDVRTRAVASVERDEAEQLIDRVKRRYISTLFLVDGDEFARGLEAMRRELRGPVERLVQAAVVSGIRGGNGEHA